MEAVSIHPWLSVRYHLANKAVIRNNNKYKFQTHDSLNQPNENASFAQRPTVLVQGDWSWKCFHFSSWLNRETSKWEEINVFRLKLSLVFHYDAFVVFRGSFRNVGHALGFFKRFSDFLYALGTFSLIKRKYFWFTGSGQRSVLLPDNFLEKHKNLEKLIRPRHSINFKAAENIKVPEWTHPSFLAWFQIIFRINVVAT